MLGRSRILLKEGGNPWLRNRRYIQELVLGHAGLEEASGQYPKILSLHCFIHHEEIAMLLWFLRP